MTDTKPNLGRFGVFGRGAPPTLTLIDRPVCATARPTCQGLNRWHQPGISRVRRLPAGSASSGGRIIRGSPRFADPVNQSAGLLARHLRSDRSGPDSRVGDWSRFTGSSIGAYVGLAPSEYSIVEGYNPAAAAVCPGEVA
jgi:hypothetical protein